MSVTTLAADYYVGVHPLSIHANTTMFSRVYSVLSNISVGLETRGKG